jgi:hypothetical protein
MCERKSAFVCQKSACGCKKIWDAEISTQTAQRRVAFRLTQMVGAQQSTLSTGIGQLPQRINLRLAKLSRFTKPKGWELLLNGRLTAPPNMIAVFASNVTLLCTASSPFVSMKTCVRDSGV